MEIKVEDDFRQQLMEQAAWSKVGVAPAGNSEAKVVEESNDGGDKCAPPAAVSEEEAAEGHVCPLCESYLEEELSEEMISEHLDYVFELIAESEDSLEEDGDDLEGALANLSEEELDELETLLDKVLLDEESDEESFDEY
ncbi:hypothetical protein CMI47_13495 [Candidatus Pacearchaeota archaeon]|nr:hypothetical protein [Candidatus Pacearchaeota archaeon]|tara:strand:+ start:3445 stop:3864 length:420 start_codon:yes stop_codon:yes gene_type:complete